MGLFSAGDDTKIDGRTNIKKSFETNDKINNSMTVESLNKIFNNIANNVVQKNAAIAAGAVGSSNALYIQNVKCDVVNVSNVHQKSNASGTVKSSNTQSNVSKISTEIITDIDKTIEKKGAVDIDGLKSKNMQAYDEFMNKIPGYDPNKAKDASKQCESSLLSAGNKCSVDASYNLDDSLKSSLDLDESFKIVDNDDISTDINNKIEQSNFASCSASSTAENAIIIQNIMCDLDAIQKKAGKQGKLNVDNIEQEAVATLYMECVFDQKSVNEISTKILNKIKKRYNQLYDAVDKKSKEKGPEYYKKATDLLDLFTAAEMDKINNAANNIDKPDSAINNQSTPAIPPPPTNPPTTPPTNPPTPPPTTPPTTKPPPTKPVATPPATTPPATTPPATSPPATTPPATSPPATEPATTEPAKTGLSGIEIAYIIGAIVFLIAIIFLGYFSYKTYKNRQIKTI
jgi:hypothetical protein